MSIVLDGTTGITTPGLTNTGTETLVNLTTTGNTTLGDATTDTLTVGVTGIVKDASGNVGIGTASPSTPIDVVQKTSDTAYALQLRGYTTGADGARTANMRAVDSANANWANMGSYASSWIWNYQGTAERMRLDSSGNLGIGTSSPDARLTIKNPNISGSQTVFTVLGATTAVDLFSVAVNQTTDVTTIGTPSGYAGSLAIQTNGTERMRIDSSGNVGVNISPNFRLDVLATASNYSTRIANNNAVPAGLYINYSAASPNNTGSEFIICNDSTTNRFIARSNGGLANYSANNVNLSDRREKTNFAPAGDYLAKICAIPVQTFNYIDQNLEEDDGLTLGVVAQDVQAVAPELVAETNWGSKDNPKMRLSIYQTDLQYALMKCIQEQQALIQSLTDRLTALEKK